MKLTHRLSTVQHNQEAQFIIYIEEEDEEENYNKKRRFMYVGDSMGAVDLVRCCPHLTIYFPTLIDLTDAINNSNALAWPRPRPTFFALGAGGTYSRIFILLFQMYLALQEYQVPVN
jgi:hypothetical protein